MGRYPVRRIGQELNNEVTLEDDAVIAAISILCSRRIPPATSYQRCSAAVLHRHNMWPTVQQSTGGCDSCCAAEWYGLLRADVGCGEADREC